MGIYQNLSGECRPAFAIFLSLSPQTRFQHFCNAFLQRRLHNKWVPWLVPRLWDVPKAYDSYDGIVSQKLKPIPPSDPMPGKSICSDSHRSWSFWYKQNSQRNCCNWKHGSWQGRPGYPTKIGFPCFFCWQLHWAPRQSSCTRYLRRVSFDLRMGLDRRRCMTSCYLGIWNCQG